MAGRDTELERKGYEHNETLDAKKVNVVQIDGTISTVNSTNVTLEVDGVFTGDAEDITNFGIILISVFSDVDSAVDGLNVEFSTDGTNWDNNDVFSISGGQGKTFSFQPAAKFYRVVYTNGSTIQTEFRLQVGLKSVYAKPSSHRVADSISGQDDAELAKAIITGETPSGVYKNVKINPEQAMSVTSFLFEVARNHILGWKMYSIPGRKDQISSTELDDITQIPNTVIVPIPDSIQMEIVSDDVNDTSGGTGIQSIDIHYLDGSGLEAEETVIMSGLTPVNTVATDITFIQWIHAKTVGSNTVAVGNIRLRDTTGATTYEFIESGGNQSLSSKYQVPSDKTGYIVGWQASGTVKEVDLRIRATVERFDRSLIPGVFLFQDNVLVNDATSGWIPFLVPLLMPAGAIIKLSAKSKAAGGNAGGQFDIVLVDN